MELSHDGEKSRQDGGEVANSPAPTKQTPPVQLSENETNILERQVAIRDASGGILQLYRYASSKDILITLLSSFTSVASGAAMPLMTVVFGNLQATFQGYIQGHLTYNDLSHQLAQMVIYFVYIAIGDFVAVYVSTIGFIYSGESICNKIRAQYLESCLRQNIGYFDQVGVGEVIVRISGDADLVQDAISYKIGLTLSALSTFIAAFIVGFVQSWKLTLILSSVVVALTLNITLGSSLIMKYTKLSLIAYVPGGSIAHEALASIRNTVAFGTQFQLAEQFRTHLTRAETFGFRAKAATGLVIACSYMIMQFGYALAFWIGGRDILYNGETLQRVLITVMVIILGSVSLGSIGPNIQAITMGLAAASKIFTTIDRPSPLDPSDELGVKLNVVEGSILFKHVKHVYPSRPKVVVMDDLSLDIPAGKTTAIVGSSGSGKSTVVSLIERFYEPLAGYIYLDGHDITRLNLKWLRQQMSLVSQEPILFSTTVYENIRHGLIGTKLESESEKVQFMLVMEAAKKAYAHDFIRSLPKGYDTNVGISGISLSGGQKQRIAIARAIVSNPKILLLDEATSALDTKSEGIVQAALESASKGRTTITIAHRLSSIKSSHKIIVMAKGKVVEQGSHEELIKKRGHYFDLVIAQNITSLKDLPSELQIRDDVLTQVKSELSQDFQSETHQDISYADQDADPVGTEGKVVETDRHTSFLSLVKLIFSFNEDELGLMVLATFFAIIAGGITPVQGILFAKAIGTLSTPLLPSNLDQLKHDSNFWAAMFVMLGGVAGVAHFLHGVVFAKCAERLIHRCRYSTFRSILRQDISFFDMDQNSPGALTAFISLKAMDLSGLSGVTLGSLIIAFTTLVAGLIVGISIGWKLGLVCASVVPVMVCCGFFRYKLLFDLQRHSKDSYTSSAGYASEAVAGIRTIASLTREDDIAGHYRSLLQKQLSMSLTSVLRSTVLFAMSDAVTYLVYALCFWYGGTRIALGEYSMFQFFACFVTVVFSAQAAGSFFTYASNVSKAYVAAQELKTLFDTKPSIDTWSRGGSPVMHVHGHIQFRDVYFRYPTRKHQPVLNGINLDIQPGQYVALVGSSGCGKSTMISLLERFYNPTRGTICLDGQDISTLKISDYRAAIALVSQEPTLYQGTIKENIVLWDMSIPDNTMERACREANIYEFIMSLPDGFDTVVGSRGVLLSGGQKQRIAIARALVRNPKILLLDEATSALDSDSEHVVQAALDAASKGRTTIAIAHRLSTVQKADVIFVLREGRIVEKGTHDSLLRMNGHYAELVTLQTL
ncbi:abc transporter [Xylariales sp. PMI_506]|nr:abc transporter [Xylariales sp. PMI_506]